MGATADETSSGLASVSLLVLMIDRALWPLSGTTDSADSEDSSSGELDPASPLLDIGG